MNHFAQRRTPPTMARRIEKAYASVSANGSYDILIGSGLLAEAGERISAVASGSRCAIVTDANVAPLICRAPGQSESEGIRSRQIIVEPAKLQVLSVFGQVCEQAIAAKIERRDVIVALGGGVVGDLAGYVAASLSGEPLRPDPHLIAGASRQVPSGKTGINSPQGKNLIGAFHQPRWFLRTSKSRNSAAARISRGYAKSPNMD